MPYKRHLVDATYFPEDRARFSLKLFNAEGTCITDDPMQDRICFAGGSSGTNIFRTVNRGRYLPLYGGRGLTTAENSKETHRIERFKFRFRLLKCDLELYQEVYDDKGLNNEHVTWGTRKTIDFKTARKYISLLYKSGMFLAYEVHEEESYLDFIIKRSINDISDFKVYMSLSHLRFLRACPDACVEFVRNVEQGRGLEEAWVRFFSDNTVVTFPHSPVTASFNFKTSLGHNKPSFSEASKADFSLLLGLCVMLEIRERLKDPYSTDARIVGGKCINYTTAEKNLERLVGYESITLSFGPHSWDRAEFEFVNITNEEVLKSKLTQELFTGNSRKLVWDELTSEDLKAP